MRKWILSAVFSLAVSGVFAFPTHVSTGTFDIATSGIASWNAFSWKWSNRDVQQFSLTFTNSATGEDVFTGITNIQFRMSYPEAGPYFLTLADTTVAVTSNSVTCVLPSVLATTNIPFPRRYYAEFIAYATNQSTRTLAKGMVETSWSVFYNTNNASWTPIYVSWPTTSIVTVESDPIAGPRITTASNYFESVTVKTNDARLTDARTPTAHNQAWPTITATPTTVAGYGITDAATGTPVYAESDPNWGAVSNDVTGKAGHGETAYGWGNHATNDYSTGTPVYAESDPNWGAVSNDITGKAGHGETAYGWGNWFTNFGTGAGQIYDGANGAAVSGQVQGIQNSTDSWNQAASDAAGATTDVAALETAFGGHTNNESADILHLTAAEKNNATNVGVYGTHTSTGLINTVTFISSFTSAANVVVSLADTNIDRLIQPEVIATTSSNFSYQIRTIAGLTNTPYVIAWQANGGGGDSASLTEMSSLVNVLSNDVFAMESPYQPWVVVTPVNGTATVSYAHGSLVAVTMTNNTTFTFDNTDYGTTGVSRVTAVIKAGTNIATFSPTTITNAVVPTLSTSTWSDIYFRRTGNDLWKGRQ